MSGLLKFITCGSVDDGKSTLIGHILYDSKLLYADQEKALELDSKVGSRGGAIDYSLLLDGLMAEREQGITIDVAYRYFTTDKRSFIVADTPGHEEYTRNMAVGASFADLAIILIDAKQGVLVQTRRHARICVLTIGSGAKVASSITATILWMDDDELFKGKNFLFKLGTKSIPGIVTEIEHTIDVNTGEEKPADKLKKNEIAVVKIAFSDKIVCDKFKNHKTLGEFILIDRVTDMTSACGVVEEVHTEESGLYEGRVDRNVRAAIKGQKAITAVFVDGVDGVNRGFVEDVEKALNIDGRHTYLYAPKEGEDFVNVVKHLSHAGILVLLLISQKQEKELEADKVEFTKDWNKNGRDVDKAAEFIKKQSVYDGVIVNTSEYI